MDIEVGDVFWSIASDDESNYRSPNVGTRTPFPIMVVQVESNVKVSHFTGGEPDRDTNATTTFGPAEDPADYLFGSEKRAWVAYANRLDAKAEKRREQARALDERSKAVRRGVAENLPPEHLSLLAMGATPDHVRRVHESDLDRVEEGEREDLRPMNIFPHEHNSNNE